MKLIDNPYVTPMPDGVVIAIKADRGAMPEIARLMDEIGVVDMESEYDIKIAKRRRKRSCNANAYMWVLADKIAEKARLTKEDVYREAIRSVGVFSDVAVQDGKPYEELVETWSSNGVGWISETFDTKLTDNHGGNMKRVRLYKGSSRYDTKQMSRLIDWIVEEAKELGIETLTPIELEQMKREWGNAQ